MANFRGNPAAKFIGAGGVGMAAAVTANALPVITAVDPSTGDTAGGETITVWGTGFLSGDQVTVDGNATTETFVDTGKITFVTPADAAGTYDVLVVRGADNSNAVSYTYTAGGGSDLLFASDWGTATGITANAVEDGGVWDGSTNLSGSNIEVSSASGLGFPSGMTNVVGFNLNGSPSSKIFILNKFAELGVGETRYWRFYKRMSSTFVSGDRSVHIEQMTDVGGAIPVVLNELIPTSGDSWQNLLKMGLGSGSEYHQWRYDLLIDLVYRFEFSIKRLTTTGYCILGWRMYDSSDVLVAGDASIWCDWHSGAHYLDEAVLNDQETGANARILESLWFRTRSFMLASPGESQGGTTYFGGFAVSDTEWCGPWVSGEGP